MRGEKEMADVLNVIDQETPPHARGKVTIHLDDNGAFGNTPACAGKRACSRASARRCRKHPRMRGEKYALRLRLVRILETPPHARGKVDDARINTAEEGNTPACAGKSVFLVRDDVMFWKHPRMRGEKFASDRTGEIAIETPPHARGKVFHALEESLKSGNTPACAGKSNDVLRFDDRARKHPRMRGEKSFRMIRLWTE